jgi:hypothetical protein
MNNTNTTNPLLETDFQSKYNGLKAFVITNAFSINMLSMDSDLKFSRLKETEACWIAENFQHSSAVGHADTAAVLGVALGTEVPMNRTTLQMEHGVALLVGQYKGPRLEEGATALPEGASIEWWLVRHM